MLWQASAEKYPKSVRLGSLDLSKSCRGQPPLVPTPQSTEKTMVRGAYISGKGGKRLGLGWSILNYSETSSLPRCVVFLFIKHYSCHTLHIYAEARLLWGYSLAPNGLASNGSPVSTRHNSNEAFRKCRSTSEIAWAGRITFAFYPMILDYWLLVYQINKITDLVVQ